MFALASIFRAGLPAGRMIEGADDRLEAALGDLMREATAAWPELGLGTETYIQHLAKRLPADDLLAELGKVHAADLFLACACAQSLPGALAAFDGLYRPRLARVLRRLSLPDLTEDLVQDILARILVDAGGGPRIGEY